MCKKTYVTTPAVCEPNKRAEAAVFPSCERSARVRPLLDSLNRLMMLKCDLDGFIPLVHLGGI